MAGRSVVFGRAAFLCSTVLFSSCLLFSQRLEGQTNPPASDQILTGTVTDPSGAAVSSALVDFSCDTTAKSTVTSADGEFSLKLPAGKCNISIRSGSFAIYKQQLLVNDDTARNPLAIRLSLDTEKSSVTVTANQGFVAHDTQTATKTSTPLIETPQSISVITLDELTQRNVQSVTEALSYTPGVHAEAYGSDGRYDWITIRGFNAGTYGMFRDGLRWQSGQIAGRTEPYGLEELDVLKGPASVLYGQGEPGGIINMVSKRPLSTPLHQLEFDGGSYTRRQVKMDISGPLDANARLLYRVTSLIRNGDTQVDFVPDYRRYVAPAFTWLPDSKTSLTLLGEYQHDKTDWGQFLPAYGTSLPNPNGRVPVSRYTGEPGYNYFRRNQYHFGWQFERHLSKTWTVRQNSRYSAINWDGRDIYGYALESDLRTMDRLAYTGFLKSHLYSTDTQAQANWHSRSISQLILAGIDYSNGVMSEPLYWTLGPSIDVFRPVYGAAMPQLPLRSNSYQPFHQTGVYLQDQLKFRQHLILTLAGREDWAYVDTQDLVSKSDAKQNPSRFTGRAGITYLTDFGLAPYFSYSTSFLPTTGTDLYGKSFKPTTGAQYEAGVKFQPRNWRGTITASFFNINQQNVQTPDGLNTTQTGEVRSRGVELEGVTKLFSTLNIHASYLYDDMKVTRTTVANQLGKRPTLAPEQSVGLLLDYTVPRGAFRGFGGGAGARYTGITSGDSANDFMVPGYTLFDASLRYDWNAFRFSVNANNVADKQYVSVCTSTAYCNYGSGRYVVGSVRWNLPGGERSAK